MKKLSLFVALPLFLVAALAAKAPPAEKGDWKLVWYDEFDGNKLDTTKWDYQIGDGAQYGIPGWGNNELEWYQPQNVKVKKGNLIITAKKEDGKPDDDNRRLRYHYTSGRIRTQSQDEKPLFATTYGRIEARIQLPTGDGIWPAFWMLPTTETTAKYGTWAASGEIDIMEFKGRLANRVYGTLHYGQSWPGNKGAGEMYKFPSGTDGSDFHIYALEWEPGEMRWYVDDACYFKTNSWWSMGPEDEEPYAYPAPYDSPFYIILNLAVGGTFDENRVPTDDDIPAEMLVDYVRVYEKKGGYNMNVTRPIPERDTAAFDAARRTSEGSFVIDKEFKTINKESMSRNEMDKTSGNWYLLALTDFGGMGHLVHEEGGVHVTLDRTGTEVHSLQLIQHHTIAKGYTYVIEFDAKAAGPRNMAVKLGGDDDNGWAVYSSQYKPSLDTEWKHFRYKFTMEMPSDPQARLEFNLGTQDADVWIKNVTVKQVEF